MKIIAKTPQVSVLAEGTYDATVGSITPKPNETEPTKIISGFNIEGYDKEVMKETPASFVAGSPLREDTETIIRRKLTEEEEKKGFELNTLVGMKCRVVVYHKASAGGRPKPAVSIVMPAEAS